MTTPCDSPSSVAPHGTVPPARPRRVARALALCGALVVLAGSLVRLTVRDAVPQTALLFYVTPVPVLAGAALVTAALFLRASQVRRAVLTALVGAAWTAHVGLLEFRAAAAPGSRAAVRLVLWNVAFSRFGAQRTLDDVAPYDADVWVFPEAVHPQTIDDPDAPPEPDLSAWRRRFPGFAVVPLCGDLLLCSRNAPRTGTAIESGTLDDLGVYAIAEFPAAADRPAWTLVVADLVSNPLASRRAALEALRQRLASLPPGPVVLAGDLNTPADSALLAPLHHSFVESFRAAGHGWGPTWPVPAPVLQLDQVWGSAEIRFASSTAGWSWCSDHRPVVVDFDFVPRNGPDP